MSCNFLARLDNEPDYSFIVLDACTGASQATGALAYFLERNKSLEIRASNFNELVAQHKLQTVVWMKFLYMVCVLEQPFQIQVVEHPNLPTGRQLQAVPYSGAKMKMQVLDWLK